MSYLLFGVSMPDWLESIFYHLFLAIDYVIYIFINWMYRVFLFIAEVDIFAGGTQLEDITKRLYIIVGIAMLFIFAYNLILLIINPEGKQMGNMSKVVQRAIISIILVTLLPRIFTYLSIIQNHILTSNVLGHIILDTGSSEEVADQKKAGVDVALTVFSAFYHPTGQTYKSCLLSCEKTGKETNDPYAERKNCKAHEMCTKYVNTYHEAYNNDSVTTFVWNSELIDAAVDGKMEYTWIISSIAGGFALWMFLSFALDIGVRVGKLAFYQLVSPIPVMMRILPNDKSFDKWYKGLTSTYISIFVRLVIIYFCMYLITLVPDIIWNMWATSEHGSEFILVAIADVILVLGILKFAQEAPKLVTDLFGGAGDIKFGLKDKYKSAAAPLGRVADMARSGVYSKLYGGANGEGGSFWAGAWRGRRGYDKGVAATDAKSEALTDGSTFEGRMRDRLRVAAGMKTRYDAAGAEEEKKLKKARIEDREKHNQAFTDATDNFKKIAENVVTSRNSLYRSTVDYGIQLSDGSVVTEITDGAHKYNLSNKNFYEMQEVIEEAKRNNASAETVIALTQAMEKHKDHRVKIVQQTQLMGGNVLLSDDDKKYANQLSNAHKDIKNALEDGAAEVVDANGKLVSGVASEVKNIDELKAAIKAVNESKNAIKDERRVIHKRDSGYRAERADSKYVKDSKNRGGSK